jgi:hypothetical protein
MMRNRIGRPGSPSYDPGFAIELDRKDWSLNGVYMKVDNEIGNGLDYVGIQAGYHRLGPPAPGNYRILAYSAAGRLKEPKGGSDDARMYGLGVSIDQELGDGWGIFLRAFMQNDEAPVVYSGARMPGAVPAVDENARRGSCRAAGHAQAWQSPQFVMTGTRSVTSTTAEPSASSGQSAQIA